jgi:hypothetical protein
MEDFKFPARELNEICTLPQAAVLGIEPIRPELE